MVPSKPIVVQAEQVVFLKPLLPGKVLQHQLPQLSSSRFAPAPSSFLHWEASNWTLYPKWSLISTEYKGIITFLELLAVLLLLQPKTALAFFAARAHCWLLFSLLSVKTFLYFQHKCPPVREFPTFICSIWLTLYHRLAVFLEGIN